jgi:CheY-like chemotaxis protein
VTRSQPVRRDKIGRGKRVLVVNDTEEILELFEELLAELGFEVVVMSFAPRELDRIRAVNPDIVILDFIFGGRAVEGWQLLQKIRMDRELERIPVIVCTAAVEEVLEQQGYLAEQGVAVVFKPFNVDQLEDAVQRAVDMLDAEGIKLARHAVLEEIRDRPEGNSKVKRPRRSNPKTG